MTTLPQICGMRHRKTSSTEIGDVRGAVALSGNMLAVGAYPEAHAATGWIAIS